MKTWLAREVVQTSAMDCGPAVLTSLLTSHGIDASYARLRDACQTDVDGTSIDTLEQLAVEHGLEAEQVMMPPDHLLIDRANLPAIAVVLLPGRITHFVVVWRVVGPFVQIMDPAAGRRWVGREALLRDLYVHDMALPTDAWHEWARGDEACAAFRTRMRALGIAVAAAERCLNRALAAESWQKLARLDAAIRLVAELRAVGAVDATAATQLLERFVTGDDEIADRYYTARPIDGDAENIRVRGAVLVKVTGVRTGATVTEEGEPSPPQPDAPRAAMLRQLIGFARDEGVLRPAMLVLAAMALGALLVGEGIVLRALLEAPRWLGGGGGRLGAVVAVIALAVIALLVLVGLNHTLYGIGRRIEGRFRVALLRRLPRLDDAYYRSRPVSDLAERAHAAHRMRELPSLLGQLVMTSAEIVFIVAGLIWIARPAAMLALGAGAVAVAVPLLGYPALVEAELRMRTHVGALARFSLDALLGIVSLRAHAAEQVMRDEQEALLVEWARAGKRFVRRVALVDAIQLASGLAFAALLVLASADRGESASALLVIFWALMLPVLGQRLALCARQLPLLRNTILRCTEPLVARDEASMTSAPAVLGAGGITLQLDDVSVVLAGTPILDHVSVTIAAGEHVAIVGASGAGKSSMLALLLGWHRATGGRVVVDGDVLDEAGLARLRTTTAWVDPAMQLWNDTLFANLRYGNDGGASDALYQADLVPLVERMPDGLQTSLGAGGGLISGGEGQRVRFGRAIGRGDARLVVLDEPFRGLERDRRSKLLDRARSHWANATLLCVTHDISETLGFPRVLVIDGGKIVEDGAPAALAAAPASRYAQLLAAEREARARLTDPAVWRRLALSDGIVREEARP